MIEILTMLVGGVTPALGDQPWVEYPGRGEDPAHVVLVAGDEEYRSEEALPQLGKILSVHHGLRCTVLFPVDPESGEIDPTCLTNIPGLEALESADLMIIATRFRDLPDAQMRRIDDYLRAGKPVLGMRTATHGFRNAQDGPWAHYANGYKGPLEGWKGGFGRVVLGEQWIAHHGAHGSQSSRGVRPEGAAAHPTLRGILDGDVWGPSDVYRVRLPLLEGSEVVMLGQVLDRAGPGVEGDPLMGMRPGDPVAEGPRNDPMMPLAWFRTYRLPGGEPGRAFTTTLGAATDLVVPGSRRLIVNASLHLLGKEVPAAGAEVGIVGTYTPTRFGFGKFTRGLRPADHALPGADPDAPAVDAAGDR